MAGKRKISLVLADVDGTLVTEEKILTKRAHDAVNALHDALNRPAVCVAEQRPVDEDVAGVFIGPIAVANNGSPNKCLANSAGNATLVQRGRRAPRVSNRVGLQHRAGTRYPAPASLPP